MNKQKGTTLFEKDYFTELERIKDTIKTNQNKAMVVVNSAMIITYYEIGTIINERKTWGSRYIQNLANDLKEYGRGYCVRNLQRMMEFASKFSSNEITPQLVAAIPWGTIDTIMAKSSSHEEMLWYINQTHKNGWSRAMVLNQISMKAYERSLIEPDTTEVVTQEDLSNELFKDTYVFDFIDKHSIKTEKDLKNQMINNVIEFLQELGPGFALVGKEYRLVTPTNEEFYIDILLYHIKIHSYVVIEVKLGKFHPSDLSQLGFYVNAIDRLEKTDRDGPTIGLILCKEADKFVAKTTLKNNISKIGISKYKFIEDLPEYLSRRLKEKKANFKKKPFRRTT